MNIEQKLTTIAENQIKVYEKGLKDGSANFVGIEIEITSTISNVFELSEILFKNINTQSHTACAVLKNAKNKTIINNQVVFLYKSSYGQYGARYRDGVYSNVSISPSYDASVTIGDIYEIFDLGEMQYDN